MINKAKTMNYIIGLITVLFLNATVYAQINEIEKLVPDDRVASDRFGWDVAINGDHALVSAIEHGFDENGDNFLNFSGAIYAFSKDGSGNWIQTQKIVASDRSEAAFFGWSISMSGNRAAVGAASDFFDENGDNSLVNAGAAYVLERDSNGTWNEIQKIVASDRSAGASFGHDVAIDGGQIVVGADSDQLDVSGNNPLLAAGSAYIFQRNSNGSWSETQKLIASSRDKFDEFGTSVGINGNAVVVGAPSDDEDGAFNSGNSYIFEKDGSGTWNETQRIVPLDIAGGDQFGYASSIQNGMVLIGSIRQEFDADGNNQLLNSGAAYIFEKEGNGSWTQSQKLVPADRSSSTYFGISLELKGDNAIIGATSFIKNASPAEQAYIFTRGGDNIWNEAEILQGSDQVSGDFFAFSVAISDGNIMVGSRDESEDANGGNPLGQAGAVYVFESNNLGVETVYQNLAIEQFPNPTNGKYQIQLSDTYSEINVIISNIHSQIMSEHRFLDTSLLDLELNGSSGVYFVTVKNSEGSSETLKVIKQ